MCDPGLVVLDAYENARYLCDQYYLASPELKLTQHNGIEPNAPIRIVYVPSHLYHMLFELFKNSMRAVMEHHGQDCLNIPPIEVTVVNGREDISLKISDRGGGIARSSVDHLFKYMYSTAPQPSSSEMHTVPLAGKCVHTVHFVHTTLTSISITIFFYRLRLRFTHIQIVRTIFSR